MNPSLLAAPSRRTARAAAALFALGLAGATAAQNVNVTRPAAPSRAVAPGATPAPVFTQRLSVPLVGQSSYIAQMREALLRLATDHPEVQAARAAADSGQFAVDAAKQARYPRLRIGTAAGRYDSGVAGARSESYRQVTADLRMSLLDGGVMRARVEAAEAGSGAQSEAVRSTSQKVVLDALTAYLQVQRYDLKVAIARRSTAVLGELARAEQRRVDLGATGQNDLRMASARRAGTAARESEFTALRDEAMAKFESYFRLRANPAMLPVLVLPANWRPATQDEAMRWAESRSSELAEAQGLVDQARKLTELQEASIYPTVDAVIVKTKDPRGSAVSEPTRAALELNWNFGSGFDQQLRVKTARAEIERQEARLDGVKLNLREVTSAGWNRAIAGLERERQLRQAVDESGQAFAGRRRLLELGRETLPHVLDAQVDHYTLLLDYVDAMADRQVSEFRLARATGALWIAPDDDNAWVQRLFDGPPLPVLADDAVTGAARGRVARSGG
jgi:outer membrane protein TolC